MLCTFANRLWVSDEKTTSQLTDKWADQWQTRGQFTGYCWGLQKSGINVAGAYIRGIGIYKNATKFVECTTTRSKFEISIWESQMLAKIRSICKVYGDWKETLSRYKDHDKTDPKIKQIVHPSSFFPGAWNEACFKYFRPCQFQLACKTLQSEELLMMENDQYIWLPHEHKRILLEEFLIDLQSKGLNV
jgi:hypothetical protein